MGLGASEAAPDQDLGFEAQARMLIRLLDALDVDEVDLVGNDSGGAIAQILATCAPDRVRSLTLTNCDTHGNWPPGAFLPILDLAKAGQFGDALLAFLANPELARSPAGLGVAFEFPERLTAELLGVYLAPLTASPERRDQVNRYVAAIERPPTPALLEALEAFRKPTLIVWGDDDIFFAATLALASQLPWARIS